MCQASIPVLGIPKPFRTQPLKVLLFGRSGIGWDNGTAALPTATNSCYFRSALQDYAPAGLPTTYVRYHIMRSPRGTNLPAQSERGSGREATCYHVYCCTQGWRNEGDAICIHNKRTERRTSRVLMQRRIRCTAAVSCES